ncbi:MAG TPA: VCBS repeat-containing protein, partial [Armatimonadota bacterium]|nr:VCBS repeat-containing protein [Armatimonadota bacterium]
MPKLNFGYLSLVTVLCFLLTAPVCEASFEEVTTVSFQSLCQGDIAWGDFDNDGLTDVAISGIEFTSEYGQRYFTKIYRNEGDGTFTDINANLPDVRWGALAWGDFNNDGLLDLAVTGARLPSEGDPITCIYRNDGNGIFTDINAGLPGMINSSAAWGDFNNDGLLDLAVCGTSSESTWTTKIFKNEGNGVFSDIDAAVPGVYGGQIAWGDSNNDGYIDLAICGRANTGPIAAIYLNKNGDGDFVDSGVTLSGAETGAALAWGDYNSDGHLDLVIAGTSQYGRITRIYRNNG